jgi:hypothetical protein
MGMNKNAYKVAVERPQGQRPLGRSRHSLKEVRQVGMDWIHLA